jgi:hypothetical protein
MFSGPIEVVDYVYIGGKNNLIQLNSSLGIVSIKSIEGSNWLLTPYKTRDEETILISCDYEGGDATKCIGYRSNLSIVDGHTTGDIKIKNLASLQILPSFETVLLKTKRKYVYLSCPTTVLKSKMNLLFFLSNREMSIIYRGKYSFKNIVGM